MEHMEYGYWLVVEPTPLKTMSSSIGMMTFPMENQTCSKPPTRICSWTKFTSDLEGKLWSMGFIDLMIFNDIHEDLWLESLGSQKKAVL